MRIIFMGSPDFAVGTLQALMDAGHELVCVYAQPPRRSGRGHQERPCPVHAAGQERGLEVRTPESMKDGATVADFVALKADIAVVVAYGHLLPVEVLNAPSHGCINVHASILPRWRGAAPIQRAIQAGDGESGVSIMQMTEGLDTGPVYLKRVVELDPSTTGGGLHDKLARLGAEACVDVLDGVAAKSAMPEEQSGAGVTYAHKLNTKESRIDWSHDAAVLERTIRAFNPWPQMWFEHGDERIKVLEAHVEKSSSHLAPGTIVDDRPAVACGSGQLILDRLQRAGRTSQGAAEFMRGYEMEVGSCLVSG